MAIKDDENSSVRDALENAVIEATDETPQAVDSVVDPPATEVVVDEFKVPDTWKDEDKAIFAKVTDPDVKKWLLGRDTDYTKRLTETEAKYADFDKVFEPHMERITSAGQQPAAVIKNLLGAQLVLEQKPIEGMLWLAKTYNINVGELVKALGGEHVATEPLADADPLADLSPELQKYIKGLEERVGKIDTAFESQTQTEVRLAKESMDAGITEFREAKEKDGVTLSYPYYANKAVQERMGMLLSPKTPGFVDIAKLGGVVPALKEAYYQAVRSVPGVREEVLAAEKKSTDLPVTRKRLEAARRAGVGVAGVSASTASLAPKGSVRDHLVRAMDQQS